MEPGTSPAGQQGEVGDGLAARVTDVVVRVLSEARPGEPSAHAGTEVGRLALDSMTAARLWLAVQGECAADVPLGWLAEADTIGAYARRVAEHAAGGAGAADAEDGGAAVGAKVVADPGARHEPFPLTPLQESYLIGKEPELQADAAGCHLYREFDVPALDPDRLRDAWQRLVEHHDMLRSVVTDDGRVRISDRAPEWEMPVRESADRAAFGATATAVRARMSHHLFPADACPPFAVEVTLGPDGTGRVHFGIDAMVTDGQGLDLLTAQWEACYADPRHTLPAPAASLSVRDCVVALDAARGGAAHRRDLEHWVRRLGELPGAPGLFTDAEPERGAGLSCVRRSSRTARLAPGEWDALRERAQALGVSPTSLVLTVFTEALDRHGDQRPYSLVVTTSRRPHLPSGADLLVGPFTATTFVEAVPSGRHSFEEAARLTHAGLWQAVEHSSVCGVSAQRALRGRDAGPGPLPVVFTSMLDTAGRPRERGFGAAPVYAVSQTTGVWLDHQMWEQDGALHVRWDTADACFAPGVVDAAFASLCNGLRAAAVDGPVAERPLNDLQQAYFVPRAAGEPGPWRGCQVVVSYETEERVDPLRLESAVVRLAEAHEVLRSAVTEDGAVAVRARAPRRWAVPVVEGVPAETVREAMAACPFPLGRHPQFEVRVVRGDAGDTVLLSVDLTLADARSIHLTGRELMRLYADPSAEPVLVRATGADRAGTDGDAAAGHWSRVLRDLPPGVPLPEPDAAAGPERRVRLDGAALALRPLAERCERHGVGLDAALLTAFTDVLAERFGPDFAVPVVRWDHALDARRPGEFTKLSWLPCPPRELPFAQRARVHQDALERDAAVGGSGLPELRRAVARSGGAGYPVVYTCVLDLTGRPLPAAVREGPWLSCTPDVFLDCITTLDAGRLRLSWDTAQGHAPREGLDELYETYARAVTRLAEDDGAWRETAAPVSQPAGEDGTDEDGVPVGAELHKILHTWNDTEFPFDGERLMHRPFEERAAAQPEAEALRWRGGSMTYRELNRRANRIAARLAGQGVGPETVVAVSVPRGPMMVAAVLGILKAGGVYLPMEPYLPAERAAVILEEAHAEAVVVTADREGWPVPENCPSVCADSAVAGPHPADADENPEPAAQPHNTAYIIFTSGSTGRPKGVAVAHRPVLNLLNWCERTFGFGPGDMGLCVTSLGFDLSVFDVFGLLGAGGALYIADAEQQRDPGLLLDVLVEEPVTFWNSAPTTLAQVGALLDAVRPGAGTNDLRLVFLSGDYTPLSLPDEVRAVFPRADIISLGGATEATVWSNWFRVGAIDPAWRSIPYGRPIDNCRYHVLDARMRPCPVGVEGDLYIGGECLALGYVNQPELTADRFVPDPFHDDPQERLYRTGDRALYYPDGNLSFQGRSDGQVKIRGFRVETGEIEHRLRAHDGVKEAVVLPREDGSGDRTLVAYVVARAEAAPSARELRSFAGQTLPEYMVPNFIGFLSQFPATANGKLDRAGLPWPLGKEHLTAPETSAASESPAETPAAAPRSAADASPRADVPTIEELRERISGMFAQTLGTGAVDPDADLWDQGATSFTMVRVSGALQKAYEERFPVSALLDNPTVDAIARWVHSRLGGGAAPVAVPVPEPEPAPAPVAEPEPVAEPVQAASEVPPDSVDFFSAEERERFKKRHWNRRPEEPGLPEVALPEAEFEPELFAWRSSRRDFLDRPVEHRAFARLLGLLRQAGGPDGASSLYPSAGDTYSVQVYLHLTPDAVEGLDAGLYYYDAARHALRLLRPSAWPDRGTHFYYNRPVFDRSRFGIYLFGQRHGIEPLYADESLRYLTLESGYMGELLMLGQAAHGVGLCPIGALNTDELREHLGLDEGHVFLQAFLGGAAAHPARSAHGTAPFFAEPVRPAAEPVAEPGAEPVTHAAPAGAEAPVTVLEHGEHVTEPTAVIGMAGRFPDAPDLETFWDGLVTGRSAVAEAPPTRPEAAPEGARAVGGFLPHIDRFDSLHFHVSPQEAPDVDPQARLMLETVWQCLDDAGHTAESLRTSAGRVGVFMGAMWHDHRQQGADRWQAGDSAQIAAAGSDIANRISHFFDFRGPSLAVDTSCSSSFAALHLAVESLRRGECGAAVVGAVNLLAHPYHWGLLDGLELLSADASPAAFAAEGSGWHPGEGVGVVLLRPAGAARRARDTVHGVIEGTRVGHAGRAPRYGAPHTEALADSLARALADASVIPDDVDYVECAAAGAGIADAAELEALGSVLARCTGTAPVPVGTLKPNIGHLEAASGISQLIKSLLQLRHGQIAPTRVAAELSPLVDWDALPVELADTPRPLRPRAADGRATLLINAVGATGSYGHVVLRAPGHDTTAPDADEHAGTTADDTGRTPHTVVLSAGSADGLRVAAGRLREHLAGAGRTARLDDVAWTLQTGRASLTHRLALSADSTEGVRAGLTAFLDGRPYSGLASGVGDPALAEAPARADDVRQAVNDWLRGHRVDFARLWPAPARRVPLPVHVFAPVPHPVAVPAARQPRTEPAAPEPAAPQPVPAPVTAPVDPRDGQDRDHVRQYVIECFADASGIAADQLHARVPLEHYGLSSRLVARFNERVRRDVQGVSSTVLFEYADLAGVAEHLAAHHEGPWSGQQSAGNAPAPHTESQTSPQTTPQTIPQPMQQSAPQSVTRTERRSGPEAGAEPIAVVGIAGRYPGARDLDTFWNNLAGGVDSIGPLPAERAREGWPVDRMWGGFLDGVDRFDSLFFGITPRDAQLMDPQERQFLEVVWETLEDAGCTRARIREQLGSRVGVFVGTMYNEYPFFGVERSLTGESADTGSAVAGIANRVSYFLDLHGPSLAVDTMCSSSLTALHLAVESLRRGECAAALAGGVNLSLHPHKFRQQDRLKMASSDHRCRSFGAGGDGFVPAEAVGAVLLKPLSAAEADGDRIHAVIRGTAVNHGGKTNGYMVPNPVAQGDLVRAALRRAGADPATIGYLEAHGTGTRLGDPVEINGLNRAFAEAATEAARQRRAIGSVKSNIGHAEAAAGIAGLTKVILQLRHRTLVPSLHAEQLNPAVDWAGSPFELVRESRPWEALTGPDGTGLPRRAGLSAFGAGGANAHVVVEEYVPSPAVTDTHADTDAGTAQLIVLSAFDEDRLRAMAARLSERLGDRSGDATGDASGLADIAYTLQCGREPLRERLALVAHDVPELRRALDRFVSGDTTGCVHARTPGGDLPEGPLSGLDPAADREAELLRLARHWAAGGAVDWAGLHSVRRRPVALPSYPFAGGRHWLPEPAPVSAPVAEPGVQSAAPAPSPSGTALFGRTWRTAPALAPAQDIEGRVVCVFAAPGEPVARALLARLGPDRVTLVRAGADAGDGVPAIGDEATAAAFAEDLRADGPGAVDGIVDLTDLGRTGAEPANVWTARLVLLRRTVRALRGRGCRVLHVTEGLHAPSGGTPSLAGARMAGFVRMLDAEYRRVTGTVLDLDLEACGPQAAAGHIVAEYAAAHGPREVSVRAGVRHRADLVVLPDDGDRPLRPDPYRTYLVTGGTRGIGARVARLLVRRGARRIALTGARPLPPRDRWPLLDRGTPEAETAALVGELESLGAQVLVHSGPLSERERTDAFLRQVRERLGPVGGVVHCAGRAPVGRPSFIGKDLADFAPVLEPKTTGLEVLDELCADDRPDFFVLFSSLSALAPGLAAGVLDYAAANAFLDCYADHRARSGRPGFRSVAWPTWSESGMGTDRPDGCAPVGVGPLGDEEGLRALERVLALPAGLPARVAVCPPLAGVPADPALLLGSRDGADAGAGTDPATVSGPVPEPEPSPAGAVQPPPPVPEESLMAQPVAGPPWLAAVFSELLAIPEDALDPTALLGDLGVESVLLGEILLRLEERTGLSLDPAILLDHPTLDRLGRHLLSLGVPAGPPAAPEQPVTAPAPAPAVPGAPVADTAGKVAIVGLACRFPGAQDAAAFQRNLLDGVCSVTEVPASRWDTGSLYRAEPEPGSSISKWGGFLDGIEDFDAEAFGMGEDEARCLDPAVRLFLEGSADCLADAGYEPRELAGRDVGVFAGARLSQYGRRVGERRGAVGMGSDQNFIAARVAHHFDLHGPNLVVDSACSSSLVALQLACRSLLDGESELALAGGVDILLDEEPYLDFSAAKALSRHGRCATFDESADGFVPGEGCGVVLLKPLERALADGDRVHAVIDAVAVNNDGRTMGLTTPNPAAQAKVVRRALAAAGRRPDEVGLIEAHGTGTMIGDPIELRALTEVFREDTARTGFCAIGSVKTNVGHLLSAAGMAGLLKTVLAVRDGRIAPTLFCERPNPRFDFASSPFALSRAAHAWTAEPGRVRVGGVSAFGLGGTNAHAVVSQLDPALAAAHRPRPALPAPVYRRRRLWLEAPEKVPGTARPVTSAAAPSPPAPPTAPPPASPRPTPGASILGLTFEEPATAPGRAPLTPTGADSAASQEGRKW
ncbi:non-ribosomal peptide synthetase [Streptomyces xanthii]|nr:non-ribosomal peptide synthetase [Streptomyces xanthii]